MERFTLKAIEFGRQTVLANGTLIIDRQEIRWLATDNTFIADVAVELVSPGKETRIVHVMDAIEPRIKARGDTVVFPGFLGPARTVGDGVTRRLAEIAGTGVCPTARTDRWNPRIQ